MRVVRMVGGDEEHVFVTSQQLLETAESRLDHRRQAVIVGRVVHQATHFADGDGAAVGAQDVAHQRDQLSLVVLGHFKLASVLYRLQKLHGIGVQHVVAVLCNQRQV